MPEKVHPTEAADDSLFEGTPAPKSTRVLTARGTCLAIFLNIVYTLINAYLGLNFGMGLGFGIITVLVAYVLFHSRGEGSNRQEITTAMVASTGFTMYYLLSLSIFIQAEGHAVLPWWLVPSQDILLHGSPLDPAWIVPIIFHFVFVIAGTLLAIVIALAISDLVLARKKSTFPFYLASAVTIDTCFQSEKETRFMFKWLGIGVLLTSIQGAIHLLIRPFGFDANLVDFTPLLPNGFALGLMLNISLMAVSYIIDPKVSVTMLFAGIATYLVIAPILTATGLFIPPATPTSMQFWYTLLLDFSISPALGVMLISGFIVLGITKLKGRRQQKEQNTTPEPEPSIRDSLGFGEYFKGLFSGLSKNRWLGISAIVLVSFFVLLTLVVDIFTPFPFWISMVLALALMIPVAIIDVFILIKFVGEAGIGMGIQRIAFYEIPLATAGLKGYLPFLAYPRINPFGTTDLIGNLKIGGITGTPKRAILTAQLLKILPGSITSIVFVLAAWYFIGFPTDTFPGGGLIMSFGIVSLFATLGGAGMGLNFVTFLGGGLSIGILAAFLPISSLGVALAMFLPPTYFIPFSLGGIVRLITDRKLGKKWFQERGQIIAIGFIAGAAITQVIMSFL